MSELKNSILIGERIKKQRLLIGYSREKLAEMVDITPRFCYDLELGNKNMSVNTLLKLSTALMYLLTICSLVPLLKQMSILPLTV